VSDIVVLTEQPAEFDDAKKQQKQKGSENRELNEACAAVPPITQSMHEATPLVVSLKA
jgi:hypothetical protein